MDEDLKEYELVVNQGRRPFLMLLIAAIFFTYMLYSLYLGVIICYRFGFNEKTLVVVPDILALIAYGLCGGITFSVTKTILIDVDDDVLISRFCIGPFKRDIKSKIPNLEYISVFLDARSQFQVNLWYVGNKHYEMYFFDEKEPAMQFARLAAKKLDIDLLDATEKGNFKWIEIPK